ncbi:MAG: SMC-Scp complex subunit ScpB [Bacillota bacterium]|nr:SMC-Scp complex subunit ScpB [Bacillota bacterium]
MSIDEQPSLYAAGEQASLSDTDERPAVMDAGQLRQALECLFFVACEPLDAARLAELTGAEQAAVEAAARQLIDEYSGRGFILRAVAGGWQFTTAAALAPLVEKLYKPKFQQLSAQAMETLAIIAYRQPITRAEIGEIRQVDVDGVVTTLLEKRLIKEVGRLAGPGRAILYGTSEEFLSFFGINSLDDLPELPDDRQLTAAGADAAEE